jgi:hypothetical protein
MGREIRRVPADWEHPKNAQGRCQPMFDESFRGACERWKRRYADWEADKRPDYFDASVHEEDLQFWEWAGGPPDRKYYRPDWAEESRTHFQFYETVSEGTPLSPPMESEESLAAWLAENNPSARGRKLSYREWLAMVKQGYAPSFILAGGRLMTGVEAASVLAEPRSK